jgi:hypothetical protein
MNFDLGADADGYILITSAPSPVPQTKCVRYYMNFVRALALMRGILEKEGHAFDADNKQGEGEHESGYVIMTTMW